MALHPPGAVPVTNSKLVCPLHLPDCNRIPVIDDHLLFRDALSGAISKACPDTRFEEGRIIDEAIVALDNQVTFDLALIDLKIPGVQRSDSLMRLRKRYPRPSKSLPSVSGKL